MSAPCRICCNTTKRLIQRHYNLTRKCLSSSSCNNAWTPPRYTDYEVSKEEFKYVEKLLPSPTVPESPQDIHPTPSGWVPQTANTAEKPYWIKRTKNHMLPVYLVVKDDTNRVTSIHKIEGDIWAFDSDLRSWVGEKVQKRMLTQVHEVARCVRLKGNYVKEVGEFLVEQGL